MRGQILRRGVRMRTTQTYLDYGIALVSLIIVSVRLFEVNTDLVCNFIYSTLIFLLRLTNRHASHKITAMLTKAHTRIHFCLIRNSTSSPNMWLSLVRLTYSTSLTALRSGLVFSTLTEWDIFLTFLEKLEEETLKLFTVSSYSVFHPVCREIPPAGGTIL